jgi:hypothetical protein
MSTTLDHQQADKALRAKPEESDSSQLGLMVRAAAVLLQRAHAQLQEALGSAASRRAEVIEQMAYEIETNVLTALSLARHADDLQMERSAAHGSKSQETIRRMIGNARQIESELNAAVRSLPPTRRQLAAVDQLLMQVRASTAQLPAA